MKTIIMAGGKGTRIQSIAQDIPKPMIKINNKPVLEWEIACLKEQGFCDIIITVSHLAHVIMDYFQDGSRFGVHIAYYVEDEPLGNAGAVFKLWQNGVLEDDFLLLIADAVFHIDLKRFADFHFSCRALATVFTHPNSHPYDSGLVIADEKSKLVTGWLGREDKRPQYYKNRVNAGIHILSPEIFRLPGICPDFAGAGNKADLDRDIIMPLISSRCVYAYDSPEYVKDMGTPERFYQVSADMESGRVAAGSLRSRQKAVFFDAALLTDSRSWNACNLAQYEMTEEAAEAVKLLNNSGYFAIAAENQKEDAVNEPDSIRNKIETLLGRNGAWLDAFCEGPHAFEKITRDYHLQMDECWIINSGKQNIQSELVKSCKTVSACVEIHAEGIEVLKKENDSSTVISGGAGAVFLETVKYILQQSEHNEAADKA